MIQWAGILITIVFVFKHDRNFWARIAVLNSSYVSLYLAIYSVLCKYRICKTRDCTIGWNFCQVTVNRLYTSGVLLTWCNWWPTSAWPLLPPLVPAALPTSWCGRGSGPRGRGSGRCSLETACSLPPGSTQSPARSRTRCPNSVKCGLRIN